MTWGIHMWDEEDRLTQGEMPSIKNRVYSSDSTTFES